jgi:ribonucleoside-triphosphate reductase
MNRQELEFRKILETLDKDFSEYLLDYDYKLMEIDGLTKINNFTFRREYWSKPTDSVTINPNANLGNTGWKKNFCNLLSEMSAPLNKLSSLALIRKYGNRNNSNGDMLVKSMLEGELYHHNLTLYDSPYCIGLSVYPIVFEGLDFFSNLKSNPPKRPTSFVNQVIRYIQFASNMFAGATAITDFFANYSYYTSKLTDYSDKQRENDLQNLVHGVSDEIRISGQSPFCNLSICGPDILRTMMGNYKWGETKIDDLIPEIMRNQMIYARFFSKGMVGPDKQPLGLPYRFPITTLVADRSFEKEYLDEWRELIEGNTNLCYLNILNQYKLEEGLKSLAMCCRLTQNIEDLLKLQVNNTFGSFLQVGSHAVVTINLPRISLETKNEDKFIEVLTERLEKARQLLKIHREEILQKRRMRYHYFFKSGKLNLKRNFFSTIGFVGLPDALEYLGLNIVEPTGLKFAKRILEKMKEESVRFSQEDGVMYNIEEVPAESAAGTLAEKDRFIGGTKDYYNSQFVPLSYDIPIPTRIEVEGELQQLCTGGSISHLNINGLVEPETAYNFTMKCLTQSNLSHFALNKGFTTCSAGHTSQGVYSKCPVCGSEEIDNLTRIVGYLVPVKQWNKVKKLEFSHRKWWDIA